MNANMHGDDLLDLCERYSLLAEENRCAAGPTVDLARRAQREALLQSILTQAVASQTTCRSQSGQIDTTVEDVSMTDPARPEPTQPNRTPCEVTMHGDAGSVTSSHTNVMQASPETATVHEVEVSFTRARLGRWLRDRLWVGAADRGAKASA
jgi:hypothetical protein